MSSERVDLVANDVIAGRYRVVGKLGTGGMGTVYEAVQQDLGRPVAIKVLRGAYAEDPEAVERFRREAHAAASLGHPNIVAVTEFGVDVGGPFMVMERLAGAPLSKVIASERALAPARAARIAAQVLSALGAAHRAGIVHRDMKPDNVFLTEIAGVRDVVKVLDFGVARFTDAQGTSNLTATGAVVGTPAYMSPEQARGRVVDARTDVYAVGVLLYEMLAGCPPFRASNYHALLFAILEETPPSLRALRPELDPALCAIVERAMAKDLAARFQSADALREALSPWLAGTDAFAPTAEQPQVSAPSRGSPTGQPFASSGVPALSAAPAAPTTPRRAPAAPAAAPNGSGRVGMAIGGLLAGALVLALVLALALAARSKLARRERIAARRAQATFASQVVSPTQQGGASSSPAAAATSASTAGAAPQAMSPVNAGPLGLSADDIVDRVAASTQRPPVYASLIRGEFNGADESSVRSQVHDVLSAIGVCATLHPSPSPAGADWTVVFDVELARTGTIDGVTARGQGPLVQSVACMKQVLLSSSISVQGPSIPRSISIELRLRHRR